MSLDDTSLGRVTALRLALQARAAGHWRLDNDRLELITFIPDPDVPEEVAHQFVEATLTVPLTQGDLGIVRAFLTGETVVSRVNDLPAETGSGHWLRALGAERSVAVPIRDSRGTVRAVIAVALPEGALAEEVVAERVRAAALGLTSLL